MSSLVFGIWNAAAFNGHVVTEGALTVTIEAVNTVKGLETPQPVTVTLKNASGSAIAAEIELKDWVDACHAVGAGKKKIDVPAKGSAKADFQFAVGKGTHSALYPIHAYARWKEEGQEKSLHAVQIFETSLPLAEAGTAPRTFSANAVPVSGAFPLLSVKNWRVTWKYMDKPLVVLPVGWQGSDKQSAASFGLSASTRGTSKQAITMHPPYRGGVGTVFTEYRLKLPNVKPIRLSFFNAIRDSTPKEGKSDGVTFRVWADERMLFERHTDAKEWLPGEVDLSALAGQEFVLRLESHPGPKNNTTCDSSFWGEPVILAGPPPVQMTAAEKTKQLAGLNQALASGKGNGQFVFELAPGSRAVVAPGPNGLADGLIGFAQGGKQVVFHGFEIAVLDAKLGSGLNVEKFQAKNAADGKVVLAHQLTVEGKPAELTATLWKEGAGLRMKFECPERITDLAIGPADQKAPRVVYGHGYCINEPAAFRAGPGGHNLAASHVGFEFAQGLGLLVASDVPPDFLQVDPEQRVYQLHTHPNAMFTFVPSDQGVFDCAIKYRPLYDKQPAAGVAAKAGRFVFDYWGGRYRDDAEMLGRAFEYGATNSLVIMHVWQRWGYDYRLPDIFPPEPKLGTLEDLQYLGQTCDKYGVRWGLHDNYIDFYPDATGFSYEHITFDANGNPRKAWINTGRDAQSYQFRPDHIAPFLKRNLELLKANLHPSANFVDVFTSATTFDYRDRQGNFHSKLETRQCWGEAFATIRNTFGNNAPTSSEAGDDYLVGYIDGADCQFIQLIPQAQRYGNVLPCRDWDRVPWFDAVNHTRLSLHGAGYSNRYQGSRSRQLHGIESDDYLTTELLTGHALMIDWGAGLRGAVRKYWLAQNFIQGRAFDEISGVALAGGDIHRVTVSWKSGAQVYANRGSNDWVVAGKTLPPYGYFARDGAGESVVETLGGQVVEHSQNGKTLYVNGRGQDDDPPLRIQAAAAKLEYQGNRQFKLQVAWDVKQAPATDLQVQLNIFKPQVSRLVKMSFGGGGRPPVPTSQWQGRVVNEWKFTLPEDCTAGDYEIVANLYDTKAKKRVRLVGNEDPDRRCRIGTMVVEGKKNEVKNIRLGPAPESDPLFARGLANLAATDFGGVKTKGAFRCEVLPGKLTVTPLPGSEALPLVLRPAKLLGKPAQVAEVRALDNRGQQIGKAAFQTENDGVSFTPEREVFAYEVLLK